MVRQFAVSCSGIDDSTYCAVWECRDPLLDRDGAGGGGGDMAEGKKTQADDGAGGCEGPHA